VPVTPASLDPGRGHQLPQKRRRRGLVTRPYEQGQSSEQDVGGERIMPRFRAGEREHLAGDGTGHQGAPLGGPVIQSRGERMEASMLEL